MQSDSKVEDDPCEMLHQNISNNFVSCYTFMFKKVEAV